MSAISRTEPVVLSDAEAERLRGVILGLFKLADELGINLVTINLHKLSQPSAFECFPTGDEHIYTLPYRKFATWSERVGTHEVSFFTGNVEEDA